MIEREHRITKLDPNIDTSDQGVDHIHRATRHERMWFGTHCMHNVRKRRGKKGRGEPVGTGDVHWHGTGSRKASDGYGASSAGCTWKSSVIAGGTVKPKEIVKTFGVPMVTVKRYVKVYRDHGSKGFYASQPRHSSASVLKGPVLEQAQQLLDGARSVPEVAAELNVLPNTLH